MPVHCKCGQGRGPPAARVNLLDIGQCFLHVYLYLILTLLFLTLRLNIVCKMSTHPILIPILIHSWIQLLNWFFMAEDADLLSHATNPKGGRGQDVTGSIKVH